MQNPPRPQNHAISRAESDGARGARLAFGLDPVEGVEGFFGIRERGAEEFPEPAPALEGRPDGLVVVELAGKILLVGRIHDRAETVTGILARWQ